MEPETQTKLEEIDAKLNAIYASVEKTRKYFLIIMWVTIAMVVLPAIGLIFVVPSFISSYTSTYDELLNY
jgi:uncharacterized membrane protein YjjP (DUF1212 family)